MNSSAPKSTAPARPLPLGRITVVAVLVLAVAVAAGLLPRWRDRAALRAETRELAVPTVLVTTPVPGKAGAPQPHAAEVKAFMEASIYARANGYVKRWLVDLGADVAAGQLLAELEAPELGQELARARAELAQGEAAVALATATAARWTELLQSKAVSRQEAAEKQADLAVKSAALDGARANVRRLEELHGFLRLTAPFAGRITARRLDVGELVSATGGKELFRLTQTRTLRVFVRVPQTVARTIAPGQVAELAVPEIPGRAFPAKVVRTAGAMDPASRTLLTELEIDNPQGEILAGSFAQVRFPAAKAEVGLTLPSNCLLFRSEGLQVVVVGADGKVTLKTITSGRDFGATVEILGGVTPTDRVIINPPDSITTGAVVRVAETGGK
jgi:RND family efflux transporter MFP subunit